MTVTHNAAVIGWPVRHSLSPVLHNNWLEEHAIRARYELCPVAPAALNEFMSALREGKYVGVNVTLPYKEEVIPYMDETDDMVKAIGAVNTIAVRDGKLVGMNTDVYGFTKNLEESGAFARTKKATILGSGGASRAVAKALADMGFEQIVICARNRKKAQDVKKIASDVIEITSWLRMPEALTGSDLLVNTTSLGMLGKEALDIDLGSLPDHAVVHDIIYNPLMTRLLVDAQKHNLATVDGLGMLIHQAVPSFEAWYGVRPEVTPHVRSMLMEQLG